jgi:hypothetical protein
MEKLSVPAEIAARFALRLYGIVCVGYGFVSLWLAFTIEPGSHGIADWTRPWPQYVLFIMLGVTVFLLLRWLVLIFAILSSALGIVLICGSITKVPFPYELANLFFALFFIVPAFLTFRTWHSLR